MIRILHTADLHMGRSFTSWGDQIAVTRRQDLLRTLDQIGRVAIERSTSLVLIAGDLFDVHNPDAMLVATVRGWLTSLMNQRIQVAIIPGNHDSYWYEHSVYRDHRFPANTTVFTESDCAAPISVQLDGKTVYLYGIAYDHTRGHDPLRSMARRTQDGLHIGMLHATVDPPAAFPVAERYLPLRSAQLAATRLDFVALGHIHRSRDFGGPAGIFASQPGSPEPLALDETGPRTLNLITFDDGACRVERIPVGIRQARREQIDCNLLPANQVVARLSEMADESCILEAILTGSPDEPLDADAIQREAASSFCYLAVRDRTAVVDSAFARSIEHEQTIRGRFVRALRARSRLASDDEERATIELALKQGLLVLAKRSVR